MTSLIALCVVMIFAVAGRGQVLLTPTRLYRLGLTTEEPPPCREPSDGEKRALGLEPKGKAATFSVNGEYLCERRIFEYGDRNSYVDFVLASAHDYSVQLARRAQLLSETEKDLAERTWTLSVAPNDEVPNAKLAFIFRTALSQALGPGKVDRGSLAASDHVHVEIIVRPTADNDILFGASVKTATNRGTLTWQL